MTITITTGADTLHPAFAQVDSYALNASSRNVVHHILDGAPVVTLREAEPETGNLLLTFTTEQAALDALDVHRMPAIFRIIDTTRSTLNFRYILDGTASVELDRELASIWHLRVAFRKVT